MKCLIVDKMHEETTDMLVEIGLKVDYEPHITREEIKSVISEYHGIIIRSKTPLDKELIDLATNLHFVGRAGAGVDNLDVDYLKAKDIAIMNAPEGNRNALGEHTVGMLLSLLNNIAKSDREVRNLSWDREGNRGYELFGKTVSLLGFGNMGEAFARKLKAFDCKVLAYDKYKKSFGSEYAIEASLDQIYSESDVFSIHVPLTEETRGMVNEVFLNKFQKKIYLLNTSRGEVLPFNACLHGLKQGIIKGVGLDVLENEKLNELDVNQKSAFEYLATSDKVIMTPHIAGWSFESYKKISLVLREKIKQFMEATKN